MSGSKFYSRNPNISISLLSEFFSSASSDDNFQRKYLLDSFENSNDDSNRVWILANLVRLSNGLESDEVKLSIQFLEDVDEEER